MAASRDCAFKIHNRQSELGLHYSISARTKLLTCCMLCRKPCNYGLISRPLHSQYEALAMIATKWLSALVHVVGVSQWLLIEGGILYGSTLITAQLTWSSHATPAGHRLLLASHWAGRGQAGGLRSADASVFSVVLHLSCPPQRKSNWISA